MVVLSDMEFEKLRRTNASFGSSFNDEDARFNHSYNAYESIFRGKSSPKKQRIEQFPRLPEDLNENFPGAMLQSP